VTHQELQPDPVLAAGDALRLLADAGDLLASSLDDERTLEQVAGMAVPVFADWCGLLLLDDGGGEAEITSGRLAPELDALITDIRRARRARDGASESRRVALSGEPILAADVRAAPASDELAEDQRRLVERMAPRSYMVVPLIAHRRPLGSLTLLSTRDGRHYTPGDLGVRPGVGGALCGGHRQRARTPGGGALAAAARRRVRDRPGGPRVRRSQSSRCRTSPTGAA
jgi:GAF domain-containing protein